MECPHTPDEKLFPATCHKQVKPERDGFAPVSYTKPAGRHFAFNWEGEFFRDGVVTFMNEETNDRGGYYYIHLANDIWWLAEAGGRGDNIWDIEHEGEFSSPLAAMLAARKHFNELRRETDAWEAKMNELMNEDMDYA